MLGFKRKILAGMFGRSRHQIWKSGTQRSQGNFWMNQNLVCKFPILGESKRPKFFGLASKKC